MLPALIKKVPVGVRFMLFSALSFALMSSCVKLVSGLHIPVFEIVAARSLVSLLISFLDVKRKRLSVWGNNKKLLLARGVVGSFALVCVYYTISTIPLAEATILQYTHPIFTALLALLFLGERIQRSTIICIVFCIIGLGFIVGPRASVDGASGLPLLSVVIALLGAMGSSIAYVIVRRLSNTEDSSVIIFYFPLIALPLSLVLLGDDFVMPNLQAFILMIFVGVFTQGGQVGLTMAMKTEVASKASAYSYIQVVFSVLLGWLVFSEVPAIWTWIGGSLIILGAMVNVFGSMKARTLTVKKA